MVITLQVHIGILICCLLGGHTLYSSPASNGNPGGDCGTDHRCAPWLSGTSDRCGRKSCFVFFHEAVTESAYVHECVCSCVCVSRPWVQMEDNNRLYVPVRWTPTCCTMSPFDVWMCLPWVRLPPSCTHHFNTYNSQWCSWNLLVNMRIVWTGSDTSLLRNPIIGNYKFKYYSNWLKKIKEKHDKKKNCTDRGSVKVQEDV